MRVRFRPGRPGTPGAPEITTPTRSAPSLRWTAVPNAATYIVVRDGVEVATVADVAFLDDAAPLVEASTATP